MEFIYNDGGRKVAGWAAEHVGDCVTRAIAIATETPYQQVYNQVNLLAQSERPRKGQTRSSARNGVNVESKTTRKYMDGIGWTWVPTMLFGQGCKVHLTPNELPQGRLVVQVSHHLCAVIDGVVYDTSDPSRGGTRCVYGYWIKK